MLMKEAQKEVDNRWSLYKQMSEMDYSLEEEAAQTGLQNSSENQKMGLSKKSAPFCFIGIFSRD